jgi:hypothetical protein
MVPTVTVKVTDRVNDLGAGIGRDFLVPVAA